MLTCEHIGKRHLVMTSSNEIVFNTMILTDFVQDRDCYQPLKMLYLTSGFYNSWDQLIGIPKYIPVHSINQYIINNNIFYTIQTFFEQYTVGTLT